MIILKYKLCLLSSIFLLLCSNVFGQTDFYKIYGNDNTDYIGDMIKSESNSLFVAGYVYNASAQGMFCSKLDINGNIVWNKVFGTNNSNGYTISQLGNKIVIAGNNNNDGGNAEIHCIDENGNQNWSKEFDLGGNEDIISISNIENDIVLIGNTNAFGNMFDILFIKTEQSGNVLLAKTIGTDYLDEPRRIIKCKDNSGFLIIGSHSTLTNEFDAFIIKVNNDGEVLWSYLYGGDDSELLSDGVELENGNFIFTGTSYSFGNISNDGDIWVLSTDSLGNILFSRNYGKFGTDRGKRIIQANSNSFFITGETWSYGNDKNNAFILGIDSLGEVTNFETFGGDLFDYGVSIINNNENSVTIGGYTTGFGFGSSDFFIVNKTLDNITCYTDTFTVLNNPTFPNITPFSIVDSIVTIQENVITQESNGYFQTGEICTSLSINDNNSNDFDLLIYPNPTTDIVTLISLNKDNLITEIHCYDMIGKEIIYKKQPTNDLSLSFKNLANGIFIVNVTMKNGHITTKKIVKE